MGSSWKAAGRWPSEDPVVTRNRGSDGGKDPREDGADAAKRTNGPQAARYLTTMARATRLSEESTTSAGHVQRMEGKAMRVPSIFGIGECACGIGPGEFVLLGVRAEPGRTVFYCPSCGSAWDRLEGVESEDPRPLQEVAPVGVRYPTNEEVHRHGAVDITGSGWGSVIAELVGRRLGPVPR